MALTFVTAVTVLGVVGFLIVDFQSRRLSAFVERSARARLDELATLVAEQGIPESLPPGKDDEVVAEILNEAGRIVLASPNLSHRRPLADDPDPALRAGTVRRLSLDVLPYEDEQGIVLSQRVNSPGGDVVIHTAVSTESVNESVGALRRALLISLPLLTVAMAAFVRAIVGRMLGSVDRAAERQQAFIADASHELRSPLARMRTELEVDLAHPASADPVATRDTLLAETTRLQGLVDDLLVLARHDAGERPTDMARVGLADAVRAAVERTPARVEVHTTLEPVVVIAALPEIERSIVNLLDNAQRHARSQVTVELTRAGRWADLVVRDDGPGIPDGMEERIFERFARADTGRPHDGGAGLGLAIARGIAERHGGTLTVERGAAGGARFKLRLPLAA